MPSAAAAAPSASAAVPVAASSEMASGPTSRCGGRCTAAAAAAAATAAASSSTEPRTRLPMARPPLRTCVACVAWRAGVEQSGPDQPSSHTQQPCASLHVPWPEQPIGQMRTAQSAASHPLSHLQTPLSHVPWPLQSLGHMPTEQSSPVYPGLQ